MAFSLFRSPAFGFESRTITDEMLNKANGQIDVAGNRFWHYNILSIECIRKYKDVLDWDDLCRMQQWNESMLREFSDKINFNVISSQFHTCNVSEAFVEEFMDRLSGTWISRNGILSESFMRNHKDRLDWDYLPGFQNMSEAFVREHADLVNWNRINIHNYSDAFHRDFDHQINWNLAFCQPYLDIAFVERYFQRADWTYVWEQPQSEEFIKRFIQFVFWDDLSFWCNDLSEEFINEHVQFADLEDAHVREYVWDTISRKPRSEAFIRKNAEHVEWNLISKYSQLSETLIRDYADKLNWNTLSQMQSFTLKMIHEYKERIKMCSNIRNIIRRERAKQTIRNLDDLPSELCAMIGNDYL